MSQDALTEVEATDEQAQRIIETCLGSFPTLRLRVTGVCMTPALCPGDIVAVVSAQSRPPQLGDVVLLRHPRGLRLHRLVWGPPHDGSWRRFKADRAVYWDPPVPIGSVLGTVVAIEATHGRRSPPRRFGAVVASLMRVLLRGPLAWAGALSRSAHHAFYTRLK